MDKLDADLDAIIEYLEGTAERRRYDRENPVRGIQQITTGFRKWAQRYVADCKPNQPAKQVERASKWFGQLTGKLQAERRRLEGDASSVLRVMEETWKEVYGDDEE